jgi:hypothetical protein
MRIANAVAASTSQSAARWLAPLAFTLLASCGRPVEPPQASQTASVSSSAVVEPPQAPTSPIDAANSREGQDEARQSQQATGQSLLQTSDVGEANLRSWADVSGPDTITVLAGTAHLAFQGAVREERSLSEKECPPPTSTVSTCVVHLHGDGSGLLLPHVSGKFCYTPSKESGAFDEIDYFVHGQALRTAPSDPPPDRADGIKFFVKPEWTSPDGEQGSVTLRYVMASRCSAN